MADGEVVTAGAIRGTPLQRAQALSQLVKSQAWEAEKQGKLTDEVADALLAAGLFGILLPPEYSGLDGVLVDYFNALEEIARADGATAWCCALCNSNNHFVYRGLSEEGRAEVFGQGPVATFGALQPRGQSAATEGGFQLSGSWSWGSGSAHARWVEVQSLFQDPDGKPWMRVHILPKAEVEIDPSSWDVMGLKATMSADYSIKDKHVPAQRVFEYPMVPEMFLTTHLSDARKRGDSTRRPTAALSPLDHAATGLAGVASFAAGVARRALEELVEAAPHIKRLTAEGTQRDDSAVQVGLGEMDGRLRAARTAMLALLAEADALEANGEHINGELRINLTQAAHVLCRTARDCVVFAFDNSGSSVVYARHPLQRCLRDIFTGLKHAALSAPILGRVGKRRLGFENVGL